MGRGHQGEGRRREEVRNDGSGKFWVYLEDKTNRIWIAFWHIDGMWNMGEKEE